MNNEWFDIAYINDIEAILHGQIVNDAGLESKVRVSLTKDQQRVIGLLDARHRAEMNKLLRGYAA